MYGITPFLVIGTLFSSASINWTVLMAVITFCLSAMATLIKIFGTNNRIDDKILRESPYLKDLEKELQEKECKLEKELQEKETKLGYLKDLVNEQHTQVEKIKTELNNNSKTMSELKQDNRDLVQRLDYLLKEFMEYMD